MCIHIPTTFIFLIWLREEIRGHIMYYVQKSETVFVFLPDSNLIGFSYAFVHLFVNLIFLESILRSQLCW